MRHGPSPMLRLRSVGKDLWCNLTTYCSSLTFIRYKSLTVLQPPACSPFWVLCYKALRFPLGLLAPPSPLSDLVETPALQSPSAARTTTSYVLICTVYCILFTSASYNSCRTASLPSDVVPSTSTFEYPRLIYEVSLRRRFLYSVR